MNSDGRVNSDSIPENVFLTILDVGMKDNTKYVCLNDFVGFVFEKITKLRQYLRDSWPKKNDKKMFFR